MPQLNTQKAFGDLARAHGPLQLMLHSTPVTDRGLEHIASIPRLTELYIDTGDFTATGLSQLSNHPTMVNLSINDWHAIGWKELASRSEFKRIQSLSVSGDGFPENNFIAARAFPNLKRLTLSRMEIPDSRLDGLSQLNWLKELTLTDTRISVECLRSVMQYLTRLKKITIRGLRLPKQELEALREHLRPVTLVVVESL